MEDTAYRQRMARSIPDRPDFRIRRRDRFRRGNGFPLSGRRRRVRQFLAEKAPSAGQRRRDTIERRVGRSYASADGV